MTRAQALQLAKIQTGEYKLETMRYKFTPVSSNAKTGPIPTVMIEKSSCPESCPLKNNGCYAENFPMSLHWDKMQNSIDIDQLYHTIKALPKNQLWRYATAGDLPGVGDDIDAPALEKIAKANKGKRGFTYTHKPPTARNEYHMENATGAGFTINLSANNIEHADHLCENHFLPVVTVLPANATDKHYKTPQGRDIVTCPAAIRDDVTCATCGICAEADRSFIVGFPAHGARKKKANEIACENI